jgi:uncharacterized cofD-like protein
MNPQKQQPKLPDPLSLPRRVVALGGGTGMPNVLSGMCDLVADGDVTALTAVVTMTDDGGSSGRLRRTRGVPPPGDVRNCLVALSEEQDLLAALFQHRYGGSAELGGHALGNLILTALAEQTGSFLKAVEVSSRVLRTRGRILPATLEDVTLEAVLEDGSMIAGESTVGESEARIERIRLRPADARPTPGVVDSILEADLVVLGPGSLFTSLLPNLAVRGIADSLRRTHAVRVMVANLVSEHGEAAGLELRDHLQLVESHAGGRIVDAIVVHEGPIAADVLERYRAEGARPLTLPDRDAGSRLVWRRDLLAPGPKLRHDPETTAAGILAAWRAAVRARFTESA